MATVGSGNMYNHPTKAQRIASIRQWAEEVGVVLEGISLEQLRPAELYDIWLRLEQATAFHRVAVAGDR